MNKTMVVIAAVLAVFGAYAGDSAPFYLDTTDPLITEPISYNSSWIGDDSSATVVITDNGVEIKRTAGEGEFTWMPTTVGKHTLTYTTYIDGAAQDEVYEAVVYADWKYTVEDGKATIVETTQTEGDITIPAEIDGYPVVAIGDGVFVGCDRLTRVTIPFNLVSCVRDIFDGCTSLKSIVLLEGVAAIPSKAFAGCAALETVVIPDSVLYMGTGVFEGCDSLKPMVNGAFNLMGDILVGYTGSASKVVIPDGVRGIAGGVFVNHTEISEVEFPSTLEFIGVDAFATCTSLEAIDLPDSVVAVNDGAFRDCTWVQSVKMPKSLKTIGDAAFANCAYIPSIECADGLEEIGVGAFSNLWRMTSMKLPSSLDVIGKDAFWDCESLSSVTVPAHVQPLSEMLPDTYATLSSIAIAEGESELCEDVFAGCAGVSEIVIPSEVEDIPARAFKNCTGLTELTLPSSLLSIGDEAFSGCGKISGLVLPDRLATIGTRAFAGLSLLGAVTIPDGVTAIGSEAFSGCSAVRQVYMSANVATVSATFPDAYTKITSVIVPETTTVIMEGFLDGCSSLASFDIPIGVTEIGASAFKNCSALSSILLPDGLTSIGASAFAGLSLLEVIKIPDGVTAIGSAAFSGCSAVRQVHMPANVATVSATFPDAYSNITSLTVPETATTIIAGFLSGCSSLTSFDIPTGVTEIGASAFKNCSVLSGVVLPEGLVSIGASAFQNCDTLGSMAIPSTVTSLAAGSFGGCTRVRSVTIPGDVGTLSAIFPNAYQYITTVYVTAESEKLCDDIFSGCSALTNIEIPTSVTEIGDGAFENCTSLASVGIPAGVTSLGVGAFSGCSVLSSVTLPGGLAVLDNQVFKNCANLTEITIPASVTQIGSSVFSGCTSLLSVKFVGNAPSVASGSYNGVSASLVTYVPYESTGWDGVSTSMALPKYWPSNAGDGIYAIEELVTAYLFNGDLSDSSGRNQNLVDNGGEFTADRDGEESSAYFFSGERESLGFAKNYTNEFSFAFWCKTSVEMSAYGSAAEGSSYYRGNYVLYPSHGKDAMGLGVKVGTDGIAVVGHGSGYFQAQLTYSSNIGAGWNHIAVTVSSSGNIKIYLNGSCVKTGSNRSSRTPIFNPTPGGGSYGYYTGSIDDLLVFDMEIDSDTVAGIYQDGIEFQQEKNSIAWWDPVHLIATFDWNYEGGSSTNIEQVVDTTYLLPDTAPTRQEAEFAGWWTAPVGGARVTPTSRVMQMLAHTLYAHWRMNEYSVAFDGNGGQGAMDSVDMTVADARTLPICGFRRVNHAFAGWAIEPNGAVVYADGAQVENLSLEEGAVVTLYAVWAPCEWIASDYLDALGMEFAFDGDLPWVSDTETTHDGMASLRSGSIGASADYPERTASTVKTTVVGAGAGSFWWKVHCEEMDAEYGDWYDYAVFTVDGVEVAKIAGDSGWQKVEYSVTGSGEHTLAWTFTRDDYDEEGVEWENAAWLDEVSWTPDSVSATFAAGGATGEVPEAMTRYEGCEITLPGTGTLLNDGYIFVGWSDGETVYPAGAVYTFGGEDVTFTAVWEVKVWTFGEAVDAEGVTFETGGDTEWLVDTAMGYTNAVSAKSGAVTNGQSSWLETTVTGAGTLTFRWKVLGGIYRNNPFAYAKVELDGTECASAYLESDWAEVTVTVEGSGEHVIRWTYLRTLARDVEEGDCVWVDAVTWTPATIADPIPELPSTATAEDVAAALGGSADAKLAVNITDAANYAAYREWALGVKTADGSAVAGAETVKNAPNAWLSYALDTERLIANAPVEGDVTIDTFDNAAMDGAFDFTVNVKDITVGDGALEANIKKVFDIEGVEDLVTELFSADAVEVNTAAAEGGKVKFTVTPKKDSGGVLPDRFFFKVKMK